MGVVIFRDGFARFWGVGFFSRLGESFGSFR